MPLLSVLCYIVFILAAIVLVVVVLLQEGRGGGFGEALGSHGRETFGVGSKGINTFTGWTAAVFLGSALALHYLSRKASEGIDLDEAGGRTEQVVPGAPGGLDATTPAAPPSTPPVTPPVTPPPAPVGG